MMLKLILIIKLAYEKNRFFFDINNRFPRIVMEISAITLIILISTYYYFIYQNADNLFNILSFMLF